MCVCVVKTQREQIAMSDVRNTKKYFLPHLPLESCLCVDLDAFVSKTTDNSVFFTVKEFSLSSAAFYLEIVLFGIVSLVEKKEHFNIFVKK